MTLPALRQIDAFPITHQGQQFVCLRDPEGIVNGQILLTPQAFFIACHLDGSSDVTDIQYAFARQFGGELLISADIRQVVELLDQHGFLLTERFLGLRRRIEQAFTDAEIRPAYLADQSYPGHSGPLRAFLDGFFARADGPGDRPGPHPGEGRPARGLVAPHIDFHRGGHAYAHGYLRLFQQGKPDTVFIFGVAHASPPVPFILTRKHFDTPFGVLETDLGIVRQLEEVCGWDPYAYEIVHRTEHSIEFQAVMLAYLYGPHVRIVPVLCGFFGTEMATEKAMPESVAAFLRRCQEIVDAASPHISVIAGADLAHVGRRFGDPFDIDGTIVSGVESRDSEDLRYVTTADADGFYRSVMKDLNQRRVCGLNCIYAALKTMGPEAGRGEMLHYDYAPDPAGGIVSFADVLFR
jgi:AmmeMemoRadiSam system protein B